MSKTVQVVGVGNAIVDVLVDASEDMLAQTGLEKGTMTLLEEDKSMALLRSLDSFQGACGGSAANTIDALQRSGMQTAFIGKVKDDDLGRIFIRDMHSAGVHYQTTPLKDGPATARCIVYRTPDAERTMGVFLGASSMISADDLQKEIIAESDVLYIELYLLGHAGGWRIFQRLLTLARSAGVRIALNLSNIEAVKKHRAAVLGVLRQGVDVLIGNQEEVTYLASAGTVDKAIIWLQSHVDVSAITMGAQGSWVVGRHTKEKISVTPPRELVATTGVGDFYAAGLIYGVIRGLPLATSGRLASALASTVLPSFGVIPDEPLQDLIQKVLSQSA
ncbi:MAG: adenosine kinase [Pseudomonadota bacterium]